MRKVNYTGYRLLIGKSLWGCLRHSMMLCTKSWIDSTGKHLGKRDTSSSQTTTARDMSSLMVKMLIHLVPIVFSVVNDANIHTITTAVKDIVVNHIEK